MRIRSLLAIQTLTGSAIFPAVSERFRGSQRRLHIKCEVVCAIHSVRASPAAISERAGSRVRQQSPARRCAGAYGSSGGRENSGLRSIIRFIPSRDGVSGSYPGQNLPRRCRGVDRRRFCRGGGAGQPPGLRSGGEHWFSPGPTWEQLSQAMAEVTEPSAGRNDTSSWQHRTFPPMIDRSQ